MFGRGSFAVSGSVHGVLLLWVALGSVPVERKRSLYEQEIQPFEKKLVWYNLSERLPDVSPTASGEKRPLRARDRSKQTMVSSAKDDHTPTPLIRTPEPPVPVERKLELPNVIAVAPAPKITRPFVPPPVVERKTEEAKIAEPPRVETAVTAKPLPIE